MARRRSIWTQLSEDIYKRDTSAVSSIGKAKTIMNPDTREVTTTFADASEIKKWATNTPKTNRNSNTNRNSSSTVTSTPTINPTPIQNTPVPQLSRKEISFWESARELASQDNTYLSQRNQKLASGFSSNNVTSEQDILSSLQRTTEFSSQPIEDQQNTAREIARLTQLNATDTWTEWAPQPVTWTDWQIVPQWTTGLSQQEELLNAATENTISQEQQTFLQDIQRNGTIYDRSVEDYQEADRLFNQKLDADIEKSRLWVERQVQDLTRQTEDVTNAYEKIWGLKWFNGSGYTQGIENIKNEAKRTIGRLQTDLRTYLDATWEAKENASKSLNLWLDRAKEDFDFQLREVNSLAQIDVNALTAQYWLDPDKMQNKLDSITLWVLQQRETLIWTYIQNTRETIQVANDQLWVIESYDAYLWQQRERFTSILNSNDWQSLQGMTSTQLQWYVEDWFLSPEQWVAYLDLMVWKATGALQEAWTPSPEDITKVQELIMSGSTPAQAIQQVITDSPDSFNTDNERQNLPWSDGTLFRMWADWQPEFVDWPQWPVDQWTRQQAEDGTWYRSKQTNAPTSPTSPTTPTITPTGIMETHTETWRTLDGVAMPAFRTAYSELSEAWLLEWMSFAKWFRDQATTIAEMWERLDMPWASAEELRAAWHDVADIWHSNHETGMAIDIYSWGNWKLVKPTAEQTSILNKNWRFQNPDLPWDQWHFDYKWVEETTQWAWWRTARPAAQKNDLNFISFERQIKNNVPATLMNSEVELKQLDDRINSMREIGLSPEEAALTYMWFDINTLDSDNGDTTSQIVDIIRQIPWSLPEGIMWVISNFTNSWKINEAVTLAENTAYASIDNPDITENTARTIVWRSKDLIPLMEDFTNKFGFVEGNIEKQKNKFKNNPEATDILNKMTRLIADLQKDIWGSDFTETERQFLSPLIPSLQDPAQNALQKVRNMEEDTINQLNSVRRWLRLPEVNADTLINVNNRSDIYIKQDTIKGEKVWKEELYGMLTNDNDVSNFALEWVNITSTE